MPIFDVGKKKVLFVHIPKSGGTSVEAWIRTFAELRFHTIGKPSALRCTPQHLTNHNFLEFFGYGYFDYVFAIVRNPFDRLVSEYRMRAMEGQEGFWRAFPNFSPWLEASLAAQKSDPWHLDNHLRPQWEFLSDATVVFRFEDGMDSILARVADELGVKPPETVPHEMQFSVTAPEVKWDKRDIIMVLDHYARDFSEFGYPDAPRLRGAAPSTGQADTPSGTC